MVRDRGFEPLTPSVSRRCSTTELTARQADEKDAVARPSEQALFRMNLMLSCQPMNPLNGGRHPEVPWRNRY